MIVLNTKEAANFLGIHPITLTKKAKAGLVPAQKLGKAWRFYKPHLIDFLSGQFMTNDNSKSPASENLDLHVTPSKSEYYQLLGLSDCPQIHSSKPDLLRGECRANAVEQVAAGKAVELVGKSRLCENRSADDVRT